MDTKATSTLLKTRTTGASAPGHVPSEIATHYLHGWKGLCTESSNSVLTLTALEAT
jgi:hypothetical protein